MSSPGIGAELGPGVGLLVGHLLAPQSLFRAKVPSFCRSDDQIPLTIIIDGRPVLIPFVIPPYNLSTRTFVSSVYLVPAVITYGKSVVCQFKSKYHHIPPRQT